MEELVVSKVDLNSSYIEERLLMEKAAKRELTPEERKPAKTSIIFNPIFYTAAAGFIGGVVPWSIIEPMVYFCTTQAQIDNLLNYMTIIFPASVGFCISIIDGIISGNFMKAARCGGIGLGIGAVWGFVGSLFANWVMDFFSLIGLAFIPDATNKEGIANLFVRVAARTVAWTILGLGVGVGPGLATSSKKLFYNGIIGGLIGGFVGGFLFDPIFFVFGRTGGAFVAGFSRLVTIALLGIFVGGFVGFIEKINKTAWITMKSGGLRGKQFIIYHDTTLIGSSPRCDVYIFKDPKVEPTHAEIRKVGCKYQISDLGTSEGVYVNGYKINKRILEKGDTVVIGESLLEFQQKEAK